MEVQTAQAQPTSGFGQPQTFESNDVSAMDIDMKDDMDIDLTGDAEFFTSEEGAIAQVGLLTTPHLLETILTQHLRRSL
jgi:hypothetical protein